MTKYKINRYNAEIVPVKIERETKASVFYHEKNWSGETSPRLTRSAKISDYAEYYDTWEAAHKALTKRAADKLDNARRQLETAQGFAGNVKGLKKP